MLTWIAGVVDAVGYLSFARVYTANMSGNSVSLGIALAQQPWRMIAFRLWPIVIYVLGLLLGRIVIQVGALHETRRIASVAFLCEAVLLGIVILSEGASRTYPHSAWQALDIGLLCLAMGIQNATLTRFSSLTLHSGFVTGTLLKFAEQFVGYGAWLWQSLRSGKPLSHSLAASFQQSSLRISAFLAAAWTAYVLGAVIGTLGESRERLYALNIALGGLALLIAVDILYPLAIRDLGEQAKIP